MRKPGTTHRTAGLDARLVHEAQQAEQRWRTLVQGLGVIVCESDPRTGAFTFVNRRGEEILGYPPEQWFEDDFFRRILHPEDRDRVVAERTTAIQERSSLDIEFRVIAADGRVVWVRDIAYVEPDLPGRPSRVRGLILDISDRKASERRLSAQYATMRAMADARSLTEAAAHLLEAICSSLDWDVGLFWELDEHADRLRCVQAWHGPGVEVSEFESLSRRTLFERGIGLPGRIWETERPAWIPDVVVDANFPRAPVAFRVGLHGAFGVPVTSRGRFLGVLEFFSNFIREPDDDVLQMMWGTGAQIGQFIERRRAEDKILFQNALLESQQEATLDGILVVDAAGRVVSHNRRLCEMWGLSDEDLKRPFREVLELMARSAADPDEFVDRARSLAQGFAGARDELAVADGRSFEFYTAPLGGSDASLGRAWHFRDITERKAAEASLRRSGDRFAFLADASRILSSSLDETAVLQRLAALVVPSLADWCFVDVIAEDSTIRRIAVTHADPSHAELARRLAAFPPDAHGVHPAAEAMRTGVARYNDAVGDEALRSSAHDEEHLELLRRMAPSSALVVPLIARGRTLGAISLAVCGGRPYDRADLEFVEDVVQRAALAMDNARLYEDRSHVARTLQESLLPPSLPTIIGVDVAARFHPAGEGMDVGGDFYDIFATGPREWAIVIGDVCGKGADAAAVTALGRYTLRAAAMQARKPARILAVLNDAMLRQRSDRRFCTAAYGRLRLGGAARLTVACGGHPLPLLVRPDGTVQPVGVPGTLIGLFDDPSFHDRALVLTPGDAVVFYTDGVTEARSAEGEVFGEERLHDVLASCAGLDADGIAARVDEAVRSFQPGAARDDLALVVFKVLV